jgi:hypothetical protein
MGSTDIAQRTTQLSRRPAHLRLVNGALLCNIIEAPCLVNGGHSASLRNPEGAPPTCAAAVSICQRITAVIAGSVPSRQGARQSASAVIASRAAASRESAASAPSAADTTRASCSCARTREMSPTAA